MFQYTGGCAVRAIQQCCLLCVAQLQYSHNRLVDLAYKYLAFTLWIKAMLVSMTCPDISRVVIQCPQVDCYGLWMQEPKLTLHEAISRLKSSIAATNFLRVSTLSTDYVHRVAEYQLQLVSEAGFTQADEQSSQAALQQLRQSQVGDNSLQSMAELLCSSSQQQQTGTNSSLWDAAVKPFVPLPLASLQPKIKVSMHRAHAAYLHCHAHALLLDCINSSLQA